MADFLAVFALAISVLMVFAWYRVLSKMGFPSWYFVLFLIPFVGPFMFLYLAFAEWPIERELSDYKLQARMQERRAQHSDEEVPPLPQNLPMPPNS